MPAHNTLPHSALPFEIQPCMADHGETTLIVDSKGFVVGTIASAVWDERAVLKYPQDRGNASLILTAINSFYPMLAVLTELHDFVVLTRRASASELDVRVERTKNIESTLDEAARLLSDLAPWQGQTPLGKPS